MRAKLRLMAKPGGKDRRRADTVGAPHVHPDERRLPPARSFLVQLPAGELGDRPSRGRVEHVFTGRSTRFEGLDHLARFFAEVIALEEQGEDGEEEY